jgi:hypothetical protein
MPLAALLPKAASNLKWIEIALPPPLSFLAGGVYIVMVGGAQRITTAIISRRSVIPSRVSRRVSSSADGNDWRNGGATKSLSCFTEIALALRASVYKSASGNRAIGVRKRARSSG